MIYLKNISKKYKSTILFENVSVVFEDKINFIIGENGVGKTTLINIIAGATSLTSGEIFIKNEKINFFHGDFKKDIGFVIDFPTYPFYYTVQEFIDLVCFLYNVNKIKEAKDLNELIEFFQMSDYLNTRISNLSTGYIKRLKLLGAMMHNPSIYIFDEPFSGLDASFVPVLLEKINILSKQGFFFLISSHNNQATSFLFDTNTAFFDIKNKTITRRL